MKSIQTTFFKCLFMGLCFTFLALGQSTAQYLNQGSIAAEGYRLSSSASYAHGSLLPLYDSTQYSYTNAFDTIHSERLHQFASGASLENGRRFRFTYKGAQPHDRIEEIWDDSASMWVDERRRRHIYDTDGNISQLQYFYSGGGVEEPTSRTTFTYSKSNLIEKLVERYNAGAWENQQREIYAYDSLNRLTQKTFYWAAGAAWNTIDRNQYTYDADGRLYRDTEFNWTAGAWENDKRITYFYNGDGEETLATRQNWSGMVWRFETRKTTSYAFPGKVSEELWSEFDAGSWDTLSRTVMTYDTRGNRLTQNTERYLAGNWDTTFHTRLYYTPLWSASIEENNESENSVAELLPNPSNGLVTLRSTEGGSMNVAVYALDGKRVTTLSNIQAHAQINLNHLVSGQYIVRFTSMNTASQSSQLIQIQ